MTIIEIKALDNGAHNNQTTNAAIPIPDGWAIIPDDMVCENFPFGEVTAAEVDGVMTVTKWIPGVMPEPEPEVEPETENSVWDELDAAYTAGYDEGYREGVNTAYDE